MLVLPDKIQSISEESEHEYQVMEWLQDKLPVPRVLAYEKAEDKNYLLMTKVSGEMSCADQYMRNPEKLANLLAEGLKMLWKVDISNCTYMHGLDEKLQMAKYNVQNNLVDMENVEPETFGENGFESSEHLLKWLITNRPEEELVFSHGDFCLPNIFLSSEKISGYIDLGKAGVADRWQDIAIPETEKIIFLSKLFKVSIDELLKDELDIIGVKEVSGCGKSLVIDSNSGLYEGVLIKESIVDENILDLLEIKKVEIWKTGGNPELETKKKNS